MSVHILYEDNHLLVLLKPHGLLTQPSGTDRDSLEERAKAFIKERDRKPGNVFLEAVHRLDRPVGGIVLFAKTSKALSRLNAAQRAKQSEKIYHALVKGSLPKEGTLKHRLVHKDYRAAVDPSGKEATLHYDVLKSEGELHLVKISLETGRYHQIRAQFSEIGCPILGDQKYGSDEPWEEGIALVHAQLTIQHPISKEKITFQIPKDQYSKPFLHFL